MEVDPRGQLIRAAAAERFSLPDGVLGRLPTGSTVTAAGRTPIAAVTADRTSAAIRSDLRVVAGLPRLDRQRERLAAAGGRPAHRHRVAGAHPVDGLGDPFDIGRVDVATAHDDHVLDPAADHHLTVDQVAEIAGVQPAVGALGRPRAVHGQVPIGHAFAAQVQHPDLPVPQLLAALADRPRPRCRAAVGPAPGTIGSDRRIRARCGRPAPPAARAPARRPARCPPSAVSPTGGTTPPASPRPSRRRRPPRSTATRTGRRRPGTPAPRSRRSARRRSARTACWTDRDRASRLPGRASTLAVSA